TGETRYSGHIAVDAVAADGDALGRAGTALPPELADTFLRFDAWVGDGVVRRMLVELDVQGMAAAVGEQVPDDLVVLRFTVEWFDLGEPVSIEAPVDLVG